MKNLKLILVAIIAILFSVSAVVAQEDGDDYQLKLPTFIGDNMVLQHSTTANIWGQTRPNAKVKVTSKNSNLTMLQA